MYLQGIVVLGVVAGVLALCLAVLSQAYWIARIWRLIGRIERPAWRKGARWGVVAVLAGVSLVAVSAILRNFHGSISRGSCWTALPGLWLSSSIVAYLFIKITRGVDWLWRRTRSKYSTRHTAVQIVPSSGAESIDHSRRYFFQMAGALAGTVPFASAAYGFVAERLRFEVREVEIPIANLPAALNGFKITQLSDIHASSYMPIAQVRRAVGIANELGGNLIVLTGDLISGRTDPLEDCVTELSRLRALLGVYGCNGNHEIYAGAESVATALFRRFGMRMLRQENAEILWNGSAFNLIGVDYQRQRAVNGWRVPMLAGIEPLVRRDVPNILLSHNPNSFPRAAEMGIELSLAGHTHGGQVRVEILDHRWSPAEFLTPYVAGLYGRPLFAPQHTDDVEAAAVQTALTPRSAIYVNRGLGTIGAPVRLGVPPEITLITLRRA